MPAPPRCPPYQRRLHVESVKLFDDRRGMVLGIVISAMQIFCSGTGPAEARSTFLSRAFKIYIFLIFNTNYINYISRHDTLS